MASKILYTNFKDKIGSLVSTSICNSASRKSKLNRKRNKDKDSVRMYNLNLHVVVDVNFLIFYEHF